MVEVLGNAVAHTAGGHRPLPRADAAAGVRRAHRPWCTDCKRSHDAKQLDDAGRCPTCAPMAERRAAAAERRRLADQADAAVPKPTPKPTKTAAPARAPKPPTPPRSTADHAAAGTGMDTPSDINVDTKTVNPGDRAPSQPGRNNATSQVSLGDRAGDTANNQVDTTTPLLDPEEWTPAAELDAQVQHVTRLLRATDHHPVLLVRTLRTSAIAALEALHLVHEIHGTRPAPAPAVTPTATRPPTPAAPTRPRRVIGNTRGHAGPDVDESAVVTAYLNGTTAPDLAKTHGCGPKRIRAILDRHNVPRRDDRATRSGGTNRIQPDPQTVATIRRLYADDELSIREVSTRTGHDVRVVRRILTDAGVTIRPPASEANATDLTPDQEREVVAIYLKGDQSLIEVGRQFHIRAERVRGLVTAAGHSVRPKGGPQHGYAERLTELGVTAVEVKRWAHAQGLAEAPTNGRVRSDLVEAWAEAHPTSTTTSTAPSSNTDMAGDAA